MRIEIVVFFILLVVMLLLQIAKRYSAKKQGEKTSNKTSEKSEKMREIFALKNFWLVIFIMIGYILLLVAVSIVFPDFWKSLWENQPLFWVTIIGILIGIGLFFLPEKLALFGSPIGFVLIVVLLIGISRNIVDTWPEEKQVTTAMVVKEPRNTCSGSNRVIAQPLQWSRKISAQVGYDWAWDKAKYPGLRLNHYRSLVEVRANGKLVKKDGTLPNGTVVNSHFPLNFVIYFLQFRSLEKYPICMEVTFFKK